MVPYSEGMDGLFHRLNLGDTQTVSYQLAIRNCSRLPSSHENGVADRKWLRQFNGFNPEEWNNFVDLVEL